MVGLRAGEETLFERLGGESAVSAAVERFYARLLADPVVGPFFDGLDMRRQIAKQKAFLTLAFGGPARYDGAGLRAVHRKLVAEKGLGEKHFAIVAGHLEASLGELGVPRSQIAEILARVVRTRDDVLDR